MRMIAAHLGHGIVKYEGVTCGDYDKQADRTWHVEPEHEGPAKAASAWARDAALRHGTDSSHWTGRRRLPPERRDVERRARRYRRALSPLQETSLADRRTDVLPAPPAVRQTCYGTA